MIYLIIIKENLQILDRLYSYFMYTACFFTIIQNNSLPVILRIQMDVMVFNDIYPEGHQGGISIVMNDERVAAWDASVWNQRPQWQGLQIKKRTSQ